MSSGLIRGGLGGGANVTIETATLGSDFLVTQAWSDVAGGSMVQVSSVQVSVDLTSGQNMMIGYNGSANIGSGIELILGYQIGSETAVPVVWEQGLATPGRHVGFMVPLTSPVSGTTTIRLMASRVSGGVTIIGQTNFNLAEFSVVTF